MRILIIGGVTYDDIVHCDEFFKPLPQTIFSNKYFQMIGGTGAGKAFNLNKLGFDVSFHAYIGDDYYGKIIKQELENEHINFLSNFDKNGTERHINIINKNGERISIYAQNATFEPEIDYKKLEEMIINCDVVCLNIINYCRYLIPIIKKHNKKIWVDIHDYDGQNEYHQDFIECADYIQLSSENYEDYFDFMKHMIDMGKELVICTHGKKGSEVLTKAEHIKMPIINDFDYVDSNGAGDSFLSGFMYGYLNKYDLSICMKFSTIVSGMCISSNKLYNTSLSEEEVKKYIKKYY